MEHANEHARAMGTLRPISQKSSISTSTTSVRFQPLAFRIALLRTPTLKPKRSTLKLAVTMQNAVVVKEIGKPVTLIEQPIPAPGENEVLVKVAVAGSRFFMQLARIQQKYQARIAHSLLITLSQSTQSIWSRSRAVYHRLPSSRHLSRRCRSG